MPKLTIEIVIENQTHGKLGPTVILVPQKLSNGLT